jgi:hypothetical protein
MDETAQVIPDQSQMVLMQRRMMLDNRIKSGINWFFWIAALSLINTIAFKSGFSLTFVVGLGFTQMIDGVVSVLAEQFTSNATLLIIVGLIINICASGVFVVFGILGRKLIRWPVIVGIVLYLIDTIITLVFKDYFGAGFHVLALIGIFSGLKAINTRKSLEKTEIGISMGSFNQAG